MKQFIHKIYDRDGTYVATLSRDIVTSVPSFTWKINSGIGQMNIKLALSFKEFNTTYENIIIKLGYELRTFIKGLNDTETVRIYSGEITGYSQTIPENGKESVTVTCIGYTKQLTEQMLKEADETTTIAFNSKDPSNILKGVVDRLTGSQICYDGGSIRNTGTLVSYTFQSVIAFTAVTKVLNMTPNYWFWYVDANNIIHLDRPDEVVDHELFLGKEINSLEGEKSIDELVNSVYFVGGGDPLLYNRYTDPGSISEWGIRNTKVVDLNVEEDATAQIIANKVLDQQNIPRSFVTIKVIDDDIDSRKGYDIESFYPGQLVQVNNPKVKSDQTLWDFTFDIDSWDYDFTSVFGLPMQILEINYDFYSVTLKLSLQLENVTKRIEDINRNLDQTQSLEVPTIPT